MKVGFLIDDLTSGGAQRAVSSLANTFAKKGVDTTLITLHDAPCFYKIDENVSLVCISPPDMPKSAVKRFFAVLKRMHIIRKKVKSLHLDVLISMSFIMSCYGVFATAFTKTKAIGTERSNPYIYKATRKNTWLRRLAARLSDGFVYQTKRVMEFFPASTHKKSAVIQNAVYNPLAYSLEVSDVREDKVAAMGRLHPGKGFDVLIDAFAAVHEKHPGVILEIWGEGAEKRNLQGLIDSLDLSSCVFLKGADAQAILKIAKAKVFVLSSRFEGMPNALMEAMACGVACVSTRCDMGPEELIDNGVDGILVDVEDDAAIAQAVNEILDDEKKMIKMGRNARKKILRENNNIDVVTDKWLVYIEKILRKD